MPPHPQLRFLSLFLLLFLSFSLSFPLASAQGSSSSSSSALPSATGGSSTSAPTLPPTSVAGGSAILASSSSPSTGSASVSSNPSSYAQGCVNTTVSTSNYTTFYTAVCPSCYYNLTNTTGANNTFVITSTFVCINVTLYCYSTASNQTFNGTATPNVVSCSNTTTTFTPARVPPTTAQILANASCPTINPGEIGLVTDFTPALICAGGSVDNHYTCDPSNPACANAQGAQGIQQDSAYSTNPPQWWRCTYTPPQVWNATGCFNDSTNATYGCATQAASITGLTVVDSACYSNSDLCTPRRYMTQINNLQPDGSQQWPGQYLPPYTQYDNMVMAVVVAGAATVDASIFYPFVDELQLIQLISSFNYSFLSLSASTRIVVEFMGGVITHSRTRINGTCAYVVPFFTLIVDLSQGFVDSATWQDDCSTCGVDAYVYSDDGACNCGVPISTCIGYNSTSGVPSTAVNVTQVSCDLQIYLGFSGSDSNGAVLTSSSRTIANFRKWSFGSIYGSALSFYSGLPSLSNNFNNCPHLNANGECVT